MKNELLSISLSVILLPAHFPERSNLSIPDSRTVTISVISNEADSRYATLHLSDLGLSKKAFECAWKGYEFLLKKQKLHQTSLLAICDLSQASNRKRLYIMDVSTNEVLMTTYVAHGRGSGMDYASKFSNRANSHESSLGFYLTGSTYYGEHGLSLRLQGLEAGFNNNATKRNIVIHGAGYVGDEYLAENRYMGRSYGCPAVPVRESEEIINLLKNGSCLFIYHPSKHYLQNSRILNG